MNRATQKAIASAVDQLAREFSCSTAHVRNILTGEGHLQRMSQRATSAAKAEIESWMVAEFRGAKRPVKEVTAAVRARFGFNFSEAAVRTLMRKHGMMMSRAEIAKALNQDPVYRARATAKWRNPRCKA